MSYYNMGKSFINFIGIVEDLADPLMLGRVKIRTIGDDTSSQVETDELLWATPLSSINSASLNGVGISPTGIQVGSYAIGFYLDGEEKNMPFVLGTYHKIPSATRENIDEAYKASDHDISFLARELQSLKKEPISGSTISEPASAYNAKYPHNKTFTTKSGHAIEIDDTPGDERIHIYHKAGTYTEINKDGRRVQKIVGEDYELVKEGKNLLVKGNLTIEAGDTTITINGDSTIDVSGSINIKASDITIDSDVQINGDLNVSGKIRSPDIKET